MTRHERAEIDLTTDKEIIHRINACPDDYNRPGNVIWMEFRKVAQYEEKPRENDDDEDYGVNNVVKFQTEWLLVEGTVPYFLENVRAKFEAYAAHKYKVQL